MRSEPPAILYVPKPFPASETISEYKQTTQIGKISRASIGSVRELLWTLSPEEDLGLKLCEFVDSSIMGPGARCAAFAQGRFHMSHCPSNTRVSRPKCKAQAHLHKIIHQHQDIHSNVIRPFPYRQTSQYTLRRSQNLRSRALPHLLSEEKQVTKMDSLL